MKYIEMSNGKFCKVDDVVWDIFGGYRWTGLRAMFRNVIENNYALKRKVIIGDIPIYVYLHRILVGVPGIFKVVFVDGDALNLCVDNLRIWNRMGEIIGVKAFSIRSEYLGVKWDGYHGVWRAEFGGMTVGYYNNELDAALAYNCKCSELHGYRPRKNRIRKYGYEFAG